IRAGTLEYWQDRLSTSNASVTGTETRRGDRALLLRDPHGQHLALVETTDDRLFRAWEQSPVPADKQIIGLHAVRAWERELAVTASFLTSVLKFEDYGEEDGWHRYGVDGGGSGKHIELKETPGVPRGGWGVGTMHHVAWRVADEEVELAVRARVESARRRPTEVIDRFWFKSVYFLEPGGVLFEIATDGPGFTVDEDRASLGEHLVLPPWLESHRGEIEAALPPIKPATESGARL
ncbi:MAG: ring-cleaving dioxygenase, partial [Gemmatimonadaceae bacterium]